MATAETALASGDPAEIESMLVELRQEAMLPVLPALALAGLALVLNAGAFPDPLRVGLPATVLLLLPALVWLMRQANRELAAWALAVGCPGALLFLVASARLAPAVYLLPLAGGVAALSLGLVGAGAIAAGLTLALFLAPLPLAGLTSAGRLVLGIGVCGTMALVWLARRPLLTATAWSWSSYQRSHALLERARDYQVQLKQALADLADANLQLTRLNRLADGLRQTAEEARRVKEQFVANVSHELRTPLNMIIGFSEMILQAPEAYGNVPPTLLADLEVILRNSQHLSGLIDDVLDLSQIEAGRMALSKERVHFAEIVEAATTAVRPLYASKSLCLRAEVPPGLPPILCDRTRIQEVLLNLLSNAGRFTERGGVQLRAWLEGREVVVSVADTGPGIASEDLDRLFQPFQQLDGSIRRRHGGSGLGLSISKSFVELHGGRMWLESRRGVGTTCFFRLPVDEPLAPAEGASRWFSPHWYYEERARRPVAPAPVVRPRFVLLEGGQSLQRLLARYLDGTELIHVGSLEEALRELARVPTQALVVNSPSVGATLGSLSAAEGLPEGTPVVVCSVPGTGEVAEALGAAGYLIKPVSREALLAAIDALPSPPTTILIVDDEPEALTLFWRMLSSAGRGYRVLTATDGREALEVLGREQPDAMLLDLIMPNMDGFRLLETMGQDPEWRRVQVLIVSASDPAGQPVVSSAVAITRAEGLSAAELIACIKEVSLAGPPAGRPAGQAPPGKQRD